MSLKEKQIKIKRVELKYYIPSVDVNRIVNFLSSVTLSDPFNDHEDGYKITSLYFDTIDDDDLNQKLDGIMFREKYRVRIYNDDSSFGKFEIKRKLNTCIEKLSVNITSHDIDELVSGNYSTLSHYEDFAYVAERMKYKVYSPKTIVSYFRKAFYLPFNNIRITLDSNLASKGFGTNLKNVSSLINTPIQKQGYQILEIKFEDEFPDYLKKGLQNITSIYSSVSKYALSRAENNTEIYGDEPLIPF